MEPGTYTKLYVQLIFSPTLNSPIRSLNLQKRLFSYISGIVKTLGHQPLAVNGIFDHVHIFYRMKPSIDVAETVKEVKRISTTFLKTEGLLRKFNWQHGYGAFTYSQSHMNSVIQYIIRQREHHKTKSFRQEYIEFLERFDIEFDPKYLFDFHKDEDSINRNDNPDL